VRTSPWLTIALLLMVGMTGCASPAPQPPTQPAPFESAKGINRGIPALDADEVASVPAGSSGPYLGLGPRGGMVVWVEPDNAKLGGWRVRPLGRDGRPRGSTLRIADAPLSVGLVAVKSAGPLASHAGPNLGSGFLVASSEQRGEVSVVQAMLVSSAGELVGGPTVLEQKAESVLWLDAVSTPEGTLVLWAKRTGKTAELDAIGLGPRAERQPSAEIVAKDLLAWQVVPGAPGSAAALVALVSATNQATGPLTVHALDAYGKSRGTPVVVSSSATANPDVDMARVGDRFVVGWSDIRSGESRVYLAALDPSGALHGEAAPATGSTDEEALVRLAGASESTKLGFLAWEDLLDRPQEGRAIRLAPVDASARVGGARAELRVIEPDHTPELAPVQGGLGALTRAPFCRKGSHCDQAEGVPTFVQFDPSLKVVASEPMRLEALSGKLAPSSWGLSCWPDQCVALAATPSAPALVYAVRLAARSQAWQSAGGGLAPSLPPRATAIETLTTLDPIRQLTAVRLGNTTVIGWAAHADAAASAGEHPKRPPSNGKTGDAALLQFQFWPDGQAEPPPIRTLSSRAHSTGVATLAPGHPGRDEVLMAWSGMVGQRPEVFCYVMSSQPKPPQPYVLTHNRAEISEVGAVRVTDGWWVGWIDNRHDDPEVFVVKLNDRLQRVGADQRLTKVQGAATGLRMLGLESHTFMVWADARDASRPGSADIYGVVLNHATGLPLGEAQAIVTSVPHSHSPALAAMEDAVLLGFIEQAGQDSSEGAHLELWRLDSQGRPGSAPIRVSPAGGGTPTAVQLDCAGRNCRGVMTVDHGVRTELQAFAYAGTEPPRSQRLTLLGGPGGQRVPLVLLGGRLYYADRIPEGRGRVRRMSIEW
jgi:hypothetical protein